MKSPVCAMRAPAANFRVRQSCACRHVYRHVCRHAMGSCYVPSEGSRRGDHFEYRHVYTRAIGMLPAMPLRYPGMPSSSHEVTSMCDESTGMNEPASQHTPVAGLPSHHSQSSPLVYSWPTSSLSCRSPRDPRPRSQTNSAATIGPTVGPTVSAFRHHPMKSLACAMRALA